jgi:tetratricopeptide (TPR) repeat protein
VQGHYNLGLAFAGQGDLDNAMKQYREALRLDSKYANTYYALGVLYYAQNNLTEAIPAFEGYLSLEPEGAYGESARTNIAKIKEQMVKNEPTVGETGQPGDSAQPGTAITNSSATTPN